MTILTDLLSPAAGTTTALVRGGLVELRPLRAGEAAPVQAVFDAMSDHAVVQRYLSPIPRLTDGMLARLTDLAPERHVAWVAMAGSQPVGIARYVRTGPASADVAFEVVDAFQGRGVGTVLLDAVTTVAHARGIRLLQASAYAENAGSLALLRKVGLRLHTTSGIAEGESPLRLMDPAAVHREAVLRLAG